MKSATHLSCLWGVPFAAALATYSEFDTSNFDKDNVLVRDVAVIGGGQTGIFSAVNLQKLGKSVVVVEKKGRIGGAVLSYTDAQTRTHVDWGVQTYWDIPATHDYFNYLNLTTAPYNFVPSTTLYGDFRTGKLVQGVQQSQDYSAYIAQQNKYPELEYSWNLTKPVANDLLLPFKDFVIKYNLRDVAYSIFQDGTGAGSILDFPTVDVFKLVDNSFFSTSFNGESINPQPDNNQIYVAAQRLLAGNILLNATVTSSSRSNGNGGVQLIVQTPEGKKLIKANKLLISCPTVPENMKPFDLDKIEASLFSKWTYDHYFQVLVSNTGIPDSYLISNANSSTSTFNIPLLPGAYTLAPTHIAGVFRLWYGSPQGISDDKVKADIIAAIERLRPAVNSTVTTPPELITFADNTPWKMRVSADEIRNGFYDKLYALQGKRNTFYTGAAWLSHDASVLFNFTQHVVLPQMLA